VATLEGHQGAVLDLEFSRNGRRLVSASADGTARIWNVAERRASQVLSGHTNYVTVAAFSHYGQSVVTGSRDGTARIWDASSGRTAAILLGHGGPVTSVAFAPDGSRVLTGSVDGTGRVWDPGTRADLVPGGRAPSGAALTARSPDGTVTATADGNVVRLAGPGGERVLRRHADRVNSVAFSPDGTRLVTAGRDHDVIVWDVASGEPTVLPPVHFGSVADARFSPDGRWLVTAGPITAGLWDAAAGLFVTYLRGPKSPLTAAAFEPDARTIVTVERDGTVRRYVCDVCGSVADLVEEAAARLDATGRELTREERVRYLG
jgi:WD40 repeat protein